VLTSGVTDQSQTMSMPSRRGLRMVRLLIGWRVLTSSFHCGRSRRGIRLHQALDVAADELGGGIAEQQLRAWLTSRTMPSCASSSTAIGERSAKSCSLRPLASTWRRASSSSTSCCSSAG